MSDDDTVWEYDGYNQKIDTSGVHRTLRIGRDSSDFIAYLFEPMSMREENWAESNVKNALRAGASKSSHAVVCGAVETEEPQSVLQHIQMLNFQGSKGNTVVSEDGQSFTLNAMHGHDMHIVSYIAESWPIAFRGRDGGMTAEQGEKGLANTIRAGQGGSVRPHVLTREIVSDNLSPEQGEYDMESTTSLVVRRLTPQECELLMGWDSGWTEVGVTEKGELVQMADTHRYRMCGNGVVANVAHWLGSRYVASKFAAGETPKDSW